MAAKTTDAIALCPTASGAQYFLNLETGKRILRRQATSLPVPLHVIEQVEFLAKQEGQPRLKNKLLYFERRPGVPIPDDDLSAESEDFSTHGDDDDDDGFVPSIEATDSYLPSDAIVSINELVGLQNDAIEEDNFVPDHENNTTDEEMLASPCISNHRTRTQPA